MTNSTAGTTEVSGRDVSGRELAAFETMHRLLSGVWVARLIHAIAELGVADALPLDTPALVADIAAATGTDPDALHRVLRTAAAFGVFAADPDGRYLHTELSRLLRGDEPNSIRNAALIACADWQWQAWARLTDGIRSGRSAFADAFGKDMWAYFAEDDPAAGAVFQQAMADLATMTDRALASAVDLADAETVIDVGGGHGHFIAALAERNPDIEAVLFESEATLAGITEKPGAAAPARHFATRAGDFREAIDYTADIYLLKQVIHLFDDEMSVRVLRNCAASAKPGARIIVIERIITDGPESVPAKLFDMEMFVVQSQGRERTEREFAELFERAGLRPSEVTVTPSGMCLIEAIV
jgi:C-methyltransferase